jgi:hypothetical protein
VKIPLPARLAFGAAADMTHGLKKSVQYLRTLRGRKRREYKRDVLSAMRYRDWFLEEAEKGSMA